MSKELFGKLLESNNDNEEGQLTDLERELRNKIEKAKQLASALKSTPDNDDVFTTCSTGVTVMSFSSSCSQSSATRSTITRSSGKPISRTNLVLHLLRSYRSAPPNSSSLSRTSRYTFADVGNPRRIF